MAKSPGGSPHNQRFRRTPPRHTMPETTKPAAVRQSAKKTKPGKSILDAFLGGLRKLQSGIQKHSKKIKNWTGGLIRRMLLPKDAPRAAKRAYAARRLRFIVCTGSAIVVVIVLLLVLLAPGGSAASATGQTASATPTATPIPTTAPDPVETFFATTEPDPVITAPPATPKPTAKPTPKPTPKPTVKPTATPKPTAKPTATPKPTTKPTATPKPATPPPSQSTSSGSTDMNSLVAYYIVSADIYYNEVGYYTNHYDYTNEELIVLARIMQIEAGSKNGMIAVGNVIMNRVLCGRFGSNITAVVTAKNQFAYNESVTPKQSAIDAAHAVLDDEVWLVPQNAYFFKGSGTEGESWSGRPYCATIGGNYFYTYNYGGRYNGTSVPPALFDRTYKHAQYGCKPEDRVYRIQFMLKALGYSVSPDKYFGKGTKDALVAFQQSKGLTADGVAGPATIEALIKAYGVDNYIAKFAS